MSSYIGPSDDTSNLFFYISTSWWSVSFSTSPVIGPDRVFYISGNDYFRAISPRGSVKWQQSVAGASCTPALATDGTIYVGSNNNNFYALFSSGSIKWSFGTGSTITSSPSIGFDGTIYFGSYDSYIYALYPSGSLYWKYKVNSAIKSAVAIDDDGTVITSTTGGFVFAFNSNGNLKWSAQTDSGSFDVSSPSIGNNGIYIGSVSSDHSLYAFTKQGSVSWLFVSDGLIYSSPSIGPDGNIA